MLQNSTAVSYGARASTRLARGLAGATPIFGSYSWTPTTVSQSRGILSHPSVCIRFSKHIVNKLLNFYQIRATFCPILLLAHCSVDSIASVFRPIKGCGCRRPIKGCGLPPRAGGLCCFKFIRSLVWGTRTNSACKRSGRCYADIRLLFLDAYYCQPIARDSVPSARLGSLEPPHRSPRHPSCARAGQARRCAVDVLL